MSKAKRWAEKVAKAQDELCEVRADQPNSFRFNVGSDAIDFEVGTTGSVRCALGIGRSSVEVNTDRFLDLCRWGLDTFAEKEALA